MSRAGSGRGTAARMVGYRVRTPVADEARIERLLRGAEDAGVVHRGQWGGSRGCWWWNGVPGRQMRALRDAIGGESGWPEEAA